MIISVYHVISSEDHVIIDLMPQSIPIDGEILHMGSDQGLPSAADPRATDHHRSDIVYTMGR